MTKSAVKSTDLTYQQLSAVQEALLKPKTAGDKMDESLRQIAPKWVSNLIKNLLAMNC